MPPPSTVTPVPPGPDDAEHDDEDRPTIVPAFDPEALARATAKEPPAEADSEDEDRPTIVPAFDPEALARTSELREVTARPVTDEPTIDEAKRLLARGEAEKALALLTRLLDVLPLHSEANTLSAECRAAVERDCISTIGSLATVLAVAVSPEELRGYGLDNLSGFLISLLDGATDVETVLDLCGGPRLLALRHLRDLAARGIVQPKRPSSTG